MESSQDIELINLAIQKLLEEKRIRDTSGSGEKLSEDDDEQLLSRLLSQLESLKGDSKLKQSEGSNLVEDMTSPTPRVDKATSTDTKIENGSQMESGSEEIGAEKILKELKVVRRQNTITHCLLSVMIVVTLIWQLSEVSLFLKVKNGLSHPFRSFGSMLVGMLPTRGNGINIQLDADKSSSSTKNNNHHNNNNQTIEFPHFGSTSEGH